MYEYCFICGRNRKDGEDEDDAGDMETDGALNAARKQKKGKYSEDFIGWIPACSHNLFYACEN